MAAKAVRVETEVTKTTTIKFDEEDIINILIAEARRMGVIGGPVSVSFEIRRDMLHGAEVTHVVTEHEETQL